MLKLFLYVLVGVSFVLSPVGVQAAALYLDPNEAILERGDHATVSMRIDVLPDECINAVDVTLRFTENIEVVDISRARSLFTVWLEDPVINREAKTITFVAGIPNGYCGRVAGDPSITNNVVDVIVMSPGMQIGSTESGNVAELSFAEETRILLNDGFGTDAERVLSGASLELTRTPGSQVENDWLQQVRSDDTPPEPFLITLERTANAFNNQYFIAFNTTDKQSGLAYYEIMEEPLENWTQYLWGRADAPWIRAQSPYVLKDQSLNRVIRVRAIDKAGNEYVATLVPDANQQSTPRWWYVVGGGLLVVVVLLGVGILFWQMHRAKQSAQESSLVIK